MVKEAAEEVGVGDVVPEMVERMAIAGHAAFQAAIGPSFGDWFQPETWATVDEHVKSYYRAAARANLEILREPTEAMLIAGLIPCRDDRYSLADAEAVKVWPRMIDAALSPSDGQKR